VKLSRPVVVVVAAAVLAGCSSGRQPAASLAPSPSPSAEAIAEGRPCPAAPADAGIDGRVGCVSSARGTFEPEDGPQSLILYALLDDEGFPRQWRLRMTRTDGPPVDEVIYAGSPTSYPRMLGAADANADGRDEAFAKVATHSYHSGATYDVGIFGVRDGDIYRVQIDGRPSLFQIGGVSVFGEGAECRDADLDGDPEFLLLRIDGVFGEVQRWSERVYEWSGTTLHFASRREGRMAKTGYADPLLYRYYSLRCFDFEPPFPYARG
jgi:hypothetical protein